MVARGAHAPDCGGPPFCAPIACIVPSGDVATREAAAAVAPSADVTQGVIPWLRVAVWLAGWSPYCWLMILLTGRKLI